MTEAQWLACKEPGRMLWFLLGKPATGWQRLFAWLDGRRAPERPTRLRGVSDRKLRLYAAACCRSIWELLADGRSRYAVEVGERHADGTADDDELAAALQLASDAIAAVSPSVAREYFAVAGAAGRAGKLWYWAARAAAAAVAPDAAVAAQETDAAVERTGVEWAAAVGADSKAIADAIGSKARAHIVRDLFGDPLRAAPLDTPPKTPAVVDLARTIYDQRAFGRLPELGEILQAEGRADTEWLRHCRSSRPHMRGCWVVDLLLDQG